MVCIRWDTYEKVGIGLMLIITEYFVWIKNKVWKIRSSKYVDGYNKIVKHLSDYGKDRYELVDERKWEQQTKNLAIKVIMGW